MTWEDTKQKIHERDGFSCCVCGISASKDGKHMLDAAHIWPSGKPHGGGDEEDNLISLCPNCHRLFDKLKAFYIDDETGELIWMDGILDLDTKEYASSFDPSRFKEGKTIAPGNLQYRKKICFPERT